MICRCPAQPPSSVAAFVGGSARPTWLLPTALRLSQRLPPKSHTPASVVNCSSDSVQPGCSTVYIWMPTRRTYALAGSLFSSADGGGNGGRRAGRQSVGTLAQFFAVIVAVLAAGVGAFASSTYNEGAIPVDFQVCLYASRTPCSNMSPLLARRARVDDVFDREPVEPRVDFDHSISMFKPSHFSRGWSYKPRARLGCSLRRYSLESLCHVSSMVRRALTIAYTTLYGCGVVSTFCRGSRSAASARVLRRTSPNTCPPPTKRSSAASSCIEVT